VIFKYQTFHKARTLYTSVFVEPDTEISLHIQMRQTFSVLTQIIFSLHSTTVTIITILHIPRTDVRLKLIHVTQRRSHIIMTTGVLPRTTYFNNDNGMRIRSELSWVERSSNRCNNQNCRSPREKFAVLRSINCLS
jgi:hypothetical protein